MVRWVLVIKKIINQFENNDISILVSTTVISEIDIKNATVMVVEHSESSD